MPSSAGDDCDDADPSRFAGAVEVCDAEGHDEDCDLTTLGATDVDGDGAISAACCNGATCGGDCNDGDPLVGPLQREACNGRDDDCDGTTDMAERSLCPGGMCSSARCTFTAWDRTFGGDNVDSASIVTIDDEGNVYAAIAVTGTLDLGAGAIVTDDQDTLVVRYSPEGIFQWATSWLVLPGLQYPAHGLEVTPGRRVRDAAHPGPRRPRRRGARRVLHRARRAPRRGRRLPLGSRGLGHAGPRGHARGRGEDVVTVATRRIERYRRDGTLVWSEDYEGSSGVQGFVQARPALRGDGIVVAGIRPGTDAYFVGELSAEDGSLGVERADRRGPSSRRASACSATAAST
ncbi:MAG: putative metal-binding motif-containing protein [Sandaracinaceae bacterium]|nr:putative metal-binding motif-containing protein [Sandaracinaceae bacterium]